MENKILRNRYAIFCNGGREPRSKTGFGPVLLPLTGQLGQPCVAPALDAQQCGNRGINIGAGVVERQRWPDGAFQPEAPQNRLSAMVAGAHRDRPRD